MTPVGIRPNTAAFRASVSEGEGLYQGMIVGLRRRLTNGLDFTASYHGSVSFEEDGACESVNCSRGSAFSQLNLRVSKGFALVGGTRVEAIAEIFNVLNAKNPAYNLTSQRVDTTTRAQLATFMQPTGFAGDFRQPEQRVGQIGFRFTF